MLLVDEVSSVLNVDEVSYCYRKNARFFYAWKVLYVYTIV